MQPNNLSCRVYRINKQSITYIKKLLKEQTDKIIYETYKKNTDKKINLCFNVKNSEDNKHGTMSEIYLDRIMLIPTRDGQKPQVHTPTYFIQILEGNEQFNDYLIIYGPKTIDTDIKRTFLSFLQKKLGDKVKDPLILLKVDFKKIDHIEKEFQNIQYFCSKDINDDRLQDIIVKGQMLESTTQYKEFVVDPTTKGDLNFLGVTIDHRILYVGRDGSIYSKSSFSRTNITNIVYGLITRIANIDAFIETLDDIA